MFFFFILFGFIWAVFFASPVKRQPVTPPPTHTHTQLPFLLYFSHPLLLCLSHLFLIQLSLFLSVSRRHDASTCSSRLPLPRRRGDRSAAEHRHAGLVHRRRQRRRAAAARAAHPLLH